MKKYFCILFVFVSINTFTQNLNSDNSLLNDAFKLATQTIDINTRRGILAAGGDYGGEWTRDIAINSLTGASLLRPEVAEKSLWSVTIHKDTIGHQYWDKIIWSIAACNHYLVTGDRMFLSQAYKCSANTMKELEQMTFDSKYGLFMGPSVFNDGIAAYPEPIFEPNNHLSGALDHKGSYRIKCLSTNCVYYGAYIALSQMSSFLKENASVTNAYQLKAELLKKNILKNFYNDDSNSFNYLVDQNGKLDHSQEALGISFATMFGILDGEKAKQLIEKAVVSKYGITSITPDFPRYSKNMPGRHNNIIWPFVNGFFAQAAIVSKNYKTFNHELVGLTHLALDADKGDYNFREIYNPYSGKPDGGYQDWGPDSLNFHWQSSRLQTWSATAYVSMVTNGLLGMKFNENTLSFSPFLPDEIGFIELKDLIYRDSKLTISVKGKGNTISSFSLDGKEQKNNSISSALKGKHTIMIILK